MLGVPIDKVARLDQETRDYVGRKLLELTLKELFVFRFMQARVLALFLTFFCFLCKSICGYSIQVSN